MKRIALGIFALSIMAAAVLPWDVEAARQEELARIEAITATTAYQIEMARREAL